MNTVIKLCRWMDVAVEKFGEAMLGVLPMLVVVLMVFMALFHLSVYIIGLIL